MRTTAIGLMVIVCMLLSPHLAGFTESGHEHGLPNLDKRHEKQPLDKPLPHIKAAAASKLKDQVRGLQVEHDPLRQSPKHIASTAGFLTGPAGEGTTISAASARSIPAGDRHRIIKAFLNEHSPLFGHGAGVLDKARLKRDFVARNNGLRTVVWEQRVDDIAIYEGVLVSHVTQRGELVSVSSQFMAEPESAADAGTPDRAALQAAPVISAAQAVMFAAESVEETVELGAIAPFAERAEGMELRQSFKAGSLPGNAQVKLVWLPMSESTLSLCWEVELTRHAGGERYRVVLDARTGEVQIRRRLTVYLTPATYNVFTSDSPSPFSPGWPEPNTNQPPAVERSRVTLSALNTNASPIGWISDGENETRGNNVDAHADRNADNIADLPRPQGLPFRVFDPPLDLSQSPETYTDAAVVQLFYWCNWMHDRLYELGFDEASGNYQKDNFGRGGLGNDAIQADTQDGSGFNNANFTPTEDGVPGRIQMFVFNGPTPNLDGDFDAEVVLHEYAHGLSTRLVGGGVGIGTLQSAGMGEGWSDFYAMALLSEPGDDIDASYAFGAYVTYQFFGLLDNYYFGIRRYPYSTDLSKNPLTFKDIDPSQISPHPGVPINTIIGFNPLFAAEVHSQGEVWCAMLWETRASLIRKHGYATGNQLILQLVTDGMKLSPPNPSFTQARDAIILADQVNNAGANYGDLWAAFAKRGLGFSAFSPDSITTSGVREAYDLPDALFLVNPAPFVASGPANGPLAPICQSYPLTNISDQPISWTAHVREPWLTLSPASGELAPGGVTNVLVCLSAEATALPLGSFVDTIRFSNTTSKVVQLRKAEVRILAFTSMPFSEDFESGIIETFWSMTGTRDHVTRISSLNGPHGGEKHVTLDCLGGTKSRNEFTLGIDLGGYTNVVLRFWAKSFGDEPDGPPSAPFLVGADFDGVAISEDGIRWYEVRSLRNIPPEYTEFVVDLDAAIAAHGLSYNATFLIRFNQVDDFQIPFDGLTFDDISITGTPATRFSVSVPERAREGDGLLPQRGVVILGKPVTTAVSVILSVDYPGKIKVPASLVISTGSDRAEFDLTVLDDSLLDGTTDVTVSAEASQYFTGKAVIAIDDNERSKLMVDLPPKAREGDLAIRGIAYSTKMPSRDVVVRLTSSDPDELQVQSTVTIPAGKTSAYFDLWPVDDNRIDGSKKITVTARVANWTEGSDWMQILDNDDPALFVLLPASVSEGNGTVTNAGRIRLSGTLPVDVSVHLSSSDASELRLPDSVTVPAGQQEARFNLTVIDDALIDGEQSVSVHASAPGFADGTGELSVLDDETPPVAIQPQPPHLATNVPIALHLAWNPGVGEILFNGDFETGDFSGWKTVDGGYGAWIINDGTIDPDGPEGTNAPASGMFNAMTAQIGGGNHLLYQDVFIPADTLGATLSWSDRIRNHTPYFAPNQVFRVDILDTNNFVIATAFTTTLGDPLLQDWTRRQFDITQFRGRTVRIGFYQEDSTGYFNAYVDDVSVYLAEPPTATTYDVYFGHSPIPGPPEFLGHTTSPVFELPFLDLNTTYYWQILARRGEATTPGPVWQFTTRGVGTIHHFEWSQIPSPQLIDQPFAATLTAMDDINNPVEDFAGSVTVTGLPGSGTGSSVVISEIDVGARDRVEFLNVSGAPVNLSGWQITVYDGPSWPEPLATVTLPEGTLFPAGRIFTLNDNGETPGRFPNLFVSTNINWTSAPIGNTVAVLLRDAVGNIVDFVCAGNTDPSLITSPLRIPAGEWIGLPLFVTLSSPTSTLQRTGSTDVNDASTWVNVPETFGALNSDLSLPFALKSTIAVSPTVLTNFTSGVWNGLLTVGEATSGLTLRASDAKNHLGFANEIAIGAANDLAVTINDSPGIVILGDNLTYHVIVTNSGPAQAVGVVLTNLIPPGLSFLSSSALSGACSNFGALVVCQLENLAGGDSALISITTRADSAGMATNLAGIALLAPDGFAANNSARAITAITVPSISITNLSITEGNNSTNLLRVPVRLSARCKLPVSVNYASENLTAIAGQDFEPVSGVLVFEPGITNLTVEVPIIGDLLDENLETFFINLSSPANGSIVVGQARCRILDNDPTPTLVLKDATVVEGPPGTTNFAEFRLQLNAPSGVIVGTSFTTEDRTATAPADYATTFGTISFQPGTTNGSIFVPVLGDNRFESNETFAVTLFNSFAAIVSSIPSVGTILDDDDTELDHFVWSEVPSPQFAGLPFIATLTAYDGLNRPATQFNGAVTIRGIADSREVIAGTATNLWEYPLAALFHDARTQVIYLPEDLGSAGKINALSLQVATSPGQVLSNWTIRLKHSPLTHYTLAAWDSESWTTAYQNDEPIQSSGWVTFLFSEPFDYDGASSILVDFSFNNSTYSVNGFCRSTITTQRRSLVFQTDSAFGNPLDWSGTKNPPPSMLERIPNTRFLIEKPVATVPSGLVEIKDGVWSGSLQVLEPDANIFLRANDTAGHIANGNLFTVESNADADNDGMPDAWERLYLGAITARPQDDDDGDGLTNLDEFHAGTNPADPSSIAMIESVLVRGTDVLIRFSSVRGKAYRLERADGLGATTWITVVGGIPGTGASVEVVDRGAATRGKFFYRLKISP